VDAAALFQGRTVATRATLLALGATGYDLTAAVRAGRLIRVRRGHYALPTLEPRTWQAVRIGGVLTCISAADHYGIWVPVHREAHVAMRPNASRMRRPRRRPERLTPHNRGGCALHWWPLLDEPGAHAVTVLDCLAHIIRCQPRPIALAALDSALHHRLITWPEVERVFGAVPMKHAGLMSEIDARSMSGLETIVRTLLRDAGLDVRLQVPFRGVGRVDLVVEGCVVVETDGRRFHEGPEREHRDYRRDAVLASRSRTTLRFEYWQVMREPELVLAAVLGALRAHRESPRGR